MLPFCEHKWKLLSETTTKSKFEVALASAEANGAVNKVAIPWQMCDASRKHIQVFACEECGKLKRFVENI